MELGKSPNISYGIRNGSPGTAARRSLLGGGSPGRGTSGDDAALEAMLLTAGEKGYAKATVREIAERARITEDRFPPSLRQQGGLLRARLQGRRRAACGAGERGLRGRGELARGLLRRARRAAPLRRRAAAAGKGAAARGAGGARRRLDDTSELVERFIAALDGARRAIRRPPRRQPDDRRLHRRRDRGIDRDRARRRSRRAGRAPAPDLTHLAFLQLFGEE